MTAPATNTDRQTVLGEEQSDPARGKKQQAYVQGKGRGVVKRQVVLGKLLSELLDLQGWENTVHALLTQTLEQEAADRYRAIFFHKIKGLQS